MRLSLGLGRILIRRFSRQTLSPSPFAACVVNSLENKHCFSTSIGMQTSKLVPADRIRGTDQNVWVEFGQLATECKALNLGQGFPDFHAPPYIREALTNAAKSDNPFMNQYTRSYGHQRLVSAIAQVHGQELRRELNPHKEILVTVGAYESLFCTAQGLINPGDEAIIIEPYFDCYEPMVRVAGGTPVFIPLRPGKSSGAVSSSADWKLDPVELESKFNSKTKAIFFNNPNNPLGKVYSEEEVQLVADLCKKYDVLCIADEVYEWLFYPGSKHIKIATLPGMWERTLTIGSAGKTFNVTGWKIGWTIGPQNLIAALCTVHQNCNYTCPTPIQEAVAIGFETEFARRDAADCLFTSLPASLLPKREKMAAFLSEVGMKPIVPEGGYFMIANTKDIDVELDNSVDEPKDYKFVKWLTRNKKLAGIPPSAFYSQENKHLAQDLIRFCFIKEDSSLDKAAEIMHQWRSEMK